VTAEGNDPPRTVDRATARFPVRRQRLPCSRIQGNEPRRAPKRASGSESGLTRKPAPGRFPVLSLQIRDFDRRDGFARDCTHRHSVRGCGDCAPGFCHRPRNTRAFAGSRERDAAESEPEMASSGPMATSWSRGSLLRDSAVPIPFGFARAASPGRAPGDRRDPGDRRGDGEDPRHRPARDPRRLELHRGDARVGRARPGVARRVWSEVPRVRFRPHLLPGGVRGGVQNAPGFSCRPG
jgi:hypothetical protein